MIHEKRSQVVEELRATETGRLGTTAAGEGSC
jgi:hypothetical protein